MKMNDAKHRLKKARGLIYNLMHFYIMQFSPGLKNKQTPNIKNKIHPPPNSPSWSSWPDLTESQPLLHMEDSSPVCKQGFSPVRILQ